MTEDQVIDFLKKQDMETISHIWLEIIEEIQKRWKKGKDKVPSPEELEQMVNFSKKAVIPDISGEIKGPTQLPTEVKAIPSFSIPPASQIQFGFPPRKDLERLPLGNVRYKGKTLEGGLICGAKGLTVIIKDRAISLKYEDIERIDWIKDKKETGKDEKDQETT